MSGFEEDEGMFPIRISSLKTYKMGPRLRELAPAARGSKEAAFTQPRAHLKADLSTSVLKAPILPYSSRGVHVLECREKVHRGW